MTSALLNVYKREPISFSHGEGVWLFDTDNKRYLDFFSGIAVNCLGHNHPAITAAITNQASKILHISNIFTIPAQDNLANKLVKSSFGGKVFISNSGAEALECSIKVIRHYFHSIGSSHKQKIICFSGAFHGRTIATISATKNAQLCNGFAPLLTQFEIAHYNDIQSVKDVYDDNCAAVLLEPIQGEAGIIPATDEFLRFLRSFCTDNNMLLAFDEVQCGMGRTGSLFYYEQTGVEPDILALAKGLGGGFPIGATLVREAIAAKMTPGSHGSTFGGNPLACQAANAVYDVIAQPDFLEDVRYNSIYLHNKLTDFINVNNDLFFAFRGKGLMIGLQCVLDNHILYKAFLEHNIITVLAKDNIIRLLPPLIITKNDIDYAIERMQIACHKVRNNKSKKHEDTN